MQTFSKALVCVVFACLLLSGADGAQRSFYRARGDNHFGRERHRVTARLRRCRQNHPDHHPVRPFTNALLPPDEDDDDRDQDRFHGNDNQARLPSTCHDQTNRDLFSTIRSRPLPVDPPRYQTFCILLI